MFCVQKCLPLNFNQRCTHSTDVSIPTHTCRSSFGCKILVCSAAGPHKKPLCVCVCVCTCITLSVLHLLVQFNTLNGTLTRRQMGLTALRIITALPRDSVCLTQHNFSGITPSYLSNTPTEQWPVQTHHHSYQSFHFSGTRHWLDSVITHWFSLELYWRATAVVFYELFLCRADVYACKTRTIRPDLNLFLLQLILMTSCYIFAITYSFRPYSMLCTR